MMFSLSVPELLIVALVLIAGIVLVALPGKKGAGHLSILMFGCTTILSALVYLSRLMPAISDSSVSTTLLFLVIQILPVTVLMFSLEYLYGRRQLSLHAMATIAFHGMT